MVALQAGLPPLPSLSSSNLSKVCSRQLYAGGLQRSTDLTLVHASVEVGRDWSLHRHVTTTTIIPSLSIPVQELMLVADGTGTVVHVTHKMAALLGRTVQQVLANGSAHALEQLMVEPFSQLHRTLAASIPQTAPPAHSCRSGVSFLMNELGAQGRIKTAPFRMSLKRQMHGDEALRVMCFEKRTLEQVGHDR
jgi:hypothetical protein